MLATDEDREGEAIAWHLMEELKPRVPAKRMVFHEITPEAIAQAVASPRDVDQGLVEAYQTRRVLDRLYGYELSPVLWKKVMPQLSAGRVQSVAVRLVVDRERERIAFRPAQYWDLEAEFAKDRRSETQAASDVTSFAATLVSVDGRRIAQGRDFTSVGELRGAEASAENGRGRLLHLDGGAAVALRDRLADASFSVKSVERKPYRRSPYAPFRTTTLQQEASRKLGFSAKYTMQMAQRLYENGHITYMRTDSVTLSQTALNAAQSSGQAAVRRRVRAGCAAHVRQQGQERAGGARGDPPGGRLVQDAGSVRAARRRASAVRAGLEAHRRIADEGRDRRVGVGARPRPGRRA